MDKVECRQGWALNTISDDFKKKKKIRSFFEKSVRVFFAEMPFER